MNSTLRIAAALAALLIATVSAEAKRSNYADQPSMGGHLVPDNDGHWSFVPDQTKFKSHSASRRTASRSGKRDKAPEVQMASLGPSMGQRTLTGYSDVAAPDPTPTEVNRLGLVTVDVAGGHRITVSHDFSGPIVALISDLYAHGYRFTRIKCAAHHGEGHHVRNSNHWTGDACDFFGQHPPADLVRNHGLRSGRDFADSMHVDNARNVGGVAYWNSVRHRGQTVTASAERRHHAYHHGHRRVRVAQR